MPVFTSRAPSVFMPAEPIGGFPQPSRPSVAYKIPRRRSRRKASSKPAKQDKDQQDNDYETKPTAAVISGPIERAASEPTEATKQRDD
jgi:hypothetical protein